MVVLSSDEIGELNGNKYKNKEKTRFEDLFLNEILSVNKLNENVKSTSYPNQFKYKKYSDQVQNEIIPLLFAAESLNKNALIDYTGAESIGNKPDGTILINGIKFKCEVTVADLDEDSYLRNLLLKKHGMVVLDSKVHKKGSKNKSMQIIADPISPLIINGKVLDGIKIAWNRKCNKMDERDILIITFLSHTTLLIPEDVFYFECEKFWDDFALSEEGMNFKKRKRLIILLCKVNYEYEIWDSFNEKLQRINPQEQIKKSKLANEHNRKIIEANLQLGIQKQKSFC